MPKLPNKAMPQRFPLRALSRFSENFRASAPAQCWEWQGEKTANGYGVFYYDFRRYTAHRVSYFIETGADPGMQMVCHSCDNRRCINPGHLFLGSSSENTQDMIKKGRHARGALRGEAHPKSKLDNLKVIKIRMLLLGSLSHREIGDLFGVSRHTIWQICNNKTWKHL